MYIHKLERLTKEHETLVLKINNLSIINKNLLEENLMLKEKENEYKRIFEDNPQFLINYQNIVDKMLDQITQISELKKENKRLKQFQVYYEDNLNKKKKIIREDMSVQDNNVITLNN